MTTADDNEAIASWIFEEIPQNENDDGVDELVAEDYVRHDSSMPGMLSTLVQIGPSRTVIPGVADG